MVIIAKEHLAERLEVFVDAFELSAWARETAKDEEPSKAYYLREIADTLEGLYHLARSASYHASEDDTPQSEDYTGGKLVYGIDSIAEILGLGEDTVKYWKKKYGRFEFIRQELDAKGTVKNYVAFEGDLIAWKIKEGQMRDLFSTRTFNVLSRTGCTSLEELSKRTRIGILREKNAGKAVVGEINRVLSEHGMKLATRKATCGGF